MFVREVVDVDRDRDGDILALYWQDYGRHLHRIHRIRAIWHILYGLYDYVTTGPMGQVPIKVVNNGYRCYLRSSANSTIVDNLDSQWEKPSIFHSKRDVETGFGFRLRPFG